MRSVVVLRWTVGMAVAVALYQAAAFYRGFQTSEEFEKASEEFEKVWGYVFPLMLAVWLDEDSRGRPEIYRPSFDLGLFMCMAWILYFPFYLLRTRGAKGWLWILGILSLAFLGTILQWGVYAAS